MEWVARRYLCTLRASRDLTSLRALRNRAASYNTLSPPTSASAALPRATVTTMVRALVSRSSPWTPWTQKTTICGFKTRSSVCTHDVDLCHGRLSGGVCTRIRHPWRRQARSGATANSLSGCYRKEACV